MKVNLTEDQIHSDMNKLRKMFNHFQTMSDEEIEPINKEFYGKLEGYCEGCGLDYQIELTDRMFEIEEIELSSVFVEI